MPDADPSSQEAQLQALVSAHAFSTSDEGPPIVDLGPHRTAAWLGWAAGNGIVDAVGDSPAAVRITRGFAGCP